MVLLLAVACGLSVANLYYSQPLLHSIAGSLHVGSETASLIVTFSQVGYAAGLILLVPAGDLLSRRRLVPVILLGTAAALVGTAFAPNIGVLIGAVLLVGFGSVAAQILVPLAASLAHPAYRGRVVGTVMSGLLMGILLARTLSGIIAGASSWRIVYLVAAGLAVLLAGALARFLPTESERPRLRYGALLRSTVHLFGTVPLLRRRALFGALGFAAFSVFWTTVAFMLAGPPYNYGDTVIGLFGLVGAAGALCAMFAGRLADRGLTTQTTALFVLLIAVSFWPLYAGRHSLAWLIVGIVLLDVGVQGLQITNQSLIYGIAPESRSRVNSSYMVVYFAGGGIGSAVAGVIYSAAGWSGICLAGAGIGVLALLLWVAGLRWPARSGPAAPATEAAPVVPTAVPDLSRAR
jgi:predicted MFS family arabinose efflux permease